jgi:hypothetical protein
LPWVTPSTLMKGIPNNLINHLGRKPFTQKNLHSPG